MTLGAIITMGAIGVGGTVLGKILETTGNSNGARFVEISAMATLAGIAVTCVGKALGELAKLGK